MFSIKYCFENWIQSLPCTHIISSVHVHFAVAGKVILYLIFLGVSFVYLLIQWNFVQRGNVVPWNRNSSNLKNPRNHYSGFFSVTSSDIAKEKRRSQSMSSRSSSPSLLSINDVELSPSRDEDVLEGIKGEFILHHENLEPLTTREDAPGQYDTGSPLFEMNLLILNTFNDQLGFVASLCSPSSSRAE